MIDFTHSEALLFRLLSSFFGTERVIPRMSLLAVCGGELPEALAIKNSRISKPNLRKWARANSCLFTVIDQDDNPKMVVEFFNDNTQVIEVEKVEHQRFMKPILIAAGIHYVTITDSEFCAMTNPNGDLDFVSFLHSKVDPAYMSA